MRGLASRKVDGMEWNIAFVRLIFEHIRNSFEGREYNTFFGLIKLSF